MKNINRYLNTLLAMTITVLFVAQSSRAADFTPGAYVDVQLGAISNPWQKNLSSANVANQLDEDSYFTKNSAKKSSGAVLLSVGYLINPYVGFEAGFTQYDNTKYSANLNDAMPNIANVAFFIKQQGLDANAVFHLPVAEVFTLYTKLGGEYLNTKGDINYQSSGDNENYNAILKNHRIVPAGTVGAAYNLTTNLSLEAQYKIVVARHTITTASGGTLATPVSVKQPNISIFSAGMNYKF